MREACGTGSQPMLVYATDKALEQENLPLSDALKSFIKLDNRHFKQELSQADRLGHSPDKKRSAVLGNDSQSKRLQRSVSMESVASNRASAGDLDDDMLDASFNYSHPGPARGGMSGYDDIPVLMKTGAHPGDPEPPPPPYESDVEMGSVAYPAADPDSARLAQVSLQDAASNPAKGPEMQERPNSGFLMRPNSDGDGDGGDDSNNSNSAVVPIVLVDNANQAGVAPRVDGI